MDIASEYIARYIDTYPQDVSTHAVGIINGTDIYYSNHISYSAPTKRQGITFPTPAMSYPDPIGYYILDDTSIVTYNIQTSTDGDTWRSLSPLAIAPMQRNYPITFVGTGIYWRLAICAINVIMPLAIAFIGVSGDNWAKMVNDIKRL
jgi:hypothetical protein